MRFSDRLIAQLKRHEGFSSRPYLCPAGKCTIGYGTNLEAHPAFIPYDDTASEVLTGRLAGAALVRALDERGMRWDEGRAEAAMLEETGHCHEELLRRCPVYAAWRGGADEARADVLLNMAFNIGVSGTLGFRKALSCMALGNYAGAAAEMRDSRWHVQVGRRSEELCGQMRTGRYREGA